MLLRHNVKRFDRGGGCGFDPPDGCIAEGAWPLAFWDFAATSQGCSCGTVHSRTFLCQAVVQTDQHLCQRVNLFNIKAQEVATHIQRFGDNCYAISSYGMQCHLLQGQRDSPTERYILNPVDSRTIATAGVRLVARSMAFERFASLTMADHIAIAHVTN